ncbi:hypothetical protein K505DRAFT_344335 [Melanomma pulvis-pyrius CBS 109.77]|uniref:Uncharacterized protein n=1 Tax=Melanomma pulvis-pyrius CBS 109.77 TaxID=1314802 RepID=A0A6A6WP13_9PLEO|nr:hypothetical protein K505DRAFT_344335 [Melanomma pulvis-pyrius CBS 109.77]
MRPSLPRPRTAPSRSAALLRRRGWARAMSTVSLASPGCRSRPFTPSLEIAGQAHSSSLARDKVRMPRDCGPGGSRAVGEGRRELEEGPYLHTGAVPALKGPQSNNSSVLTRRQRMCVVPESPLGARDGLRQLRRGCPSTVVSQRPPVPVCYGLERPRYGAAGQMPSRHAERLVASEVLEVGRSRLGPDHLAAFLGRAALLTAARRGRTNAVRTNLGGSSWVVFSILTLFGLEPEIVCRVRFELGGVYVIDRGPPSRQSLPYLLLKHSEMVVVKQQQHLPRNHRENDALGSAYHDDVCVH